MTMKIATGQNKQHKTRAFYYIKPQQSHIIVKKTEEKKKKEKNWIFNLTTHTSYLKNITHRTTFVDP